LMWSERASATLYSVSIQKSKATHIPTFMVKSV
jgi:hypothetical protein